MRGVDRSRYEQKLAAAHRALYNASAAAEEAQDDYAASTLEAMARGVSSIMQSSLREKSFKQRQQMDVYDELSCVSQSERARPTPAA